MLSIGEFSKICQVSTKTLRYYDEIGLLRPEKINPENGYRYYDAGQLEQMLFINRLKAYRFSLDEIRALLESDELEGEKLCQEFSQKKREMEKRIEGFQDTLDQLSNDIANLKQGRSVMSYMEDIDVTLVEVPAMNLLSIRSMIREHEFADCYSGYFDRLLRKIEDDHLTMTAPPMVLFHSDEFTPQGLDTEFAIPIEEYREDTRNFQPGSALKTVLHGSYKELPSVYAKQRQWAERQGYEGSDALYEVYITDPSEVSKESELITEIYFPVRKRREPYESRKMEKSREADRK